MFKLPMKFYAMSGGGSSSDTPASNKKYEITITQPPKHEPRPDFIKGIPYAAKDNVMFCKYRAMTLNDYKEINPEATEKPTNVHIIQDNNGNDLIITSDMIDGMSKMQMFILNENSGVSSYSYIPLMGYALKQNFNGKSIAMLAYTLSSHTYAVKISDVDSWMVEGA